MVHACKQSQTHCLLFQCMPGSFLPLVPTKSVSRIYIYGSMVCLVCTSREGAVALSACKQAHAACHRQPCLPTPKGTTRSSRDRSSKHHRIMHRHVMIMTESKGEEALCLHAVCFTSYHQLIHEHLSIRSLGPTGIDIGLAGRWSARYHLEPGPHHAAEV